MTQDEKAPVLEGFPFGRLSRWPDVQADNLLAHDASDRLILDLAADALALSRPGGVTVIGDRYGALTLGAAALGATEVRVHQDSIVGRLALDENAKRIEVDADYAHLPLGEELLASAEVVLMQLPKDLRQLSHWAALIGRFADPAVQVFAGGRLKHMTRSMNEVFSVWFEDVRASRARQKSRVLQVSTPRTTAKSDEPTLEESYDTDLDLWVCSYPGVFAAGKVDIGTRFLVPYAQEETRKLDAASSGFSPVAVDLGCGTGILAAAIMRAAPELTVVATDRSEAAVRSTEKTLDRNRLGPVEVRHDNGLSKQPDDTVDLIVCNPPFHSEAAISTQLSERIFRDAARALKPGGVMLTVFNSHLRHRSALQRIVGPTEQLGRNAKFTVTRSVKLA